GAIVATVGGGTFVLCCLGEYVGDVPGGVVIGVDGVGQVTAAAGSGVAAVGGRGVEGVVEVGGAGWGGGAGRGRVVGDDGVEGRLEELHGSFGACVVGAAGDAGEWGAAVVGLDFSDGGQNGPVQAWTGGSSGRVERVLLRGDVCHGRAAGLGGAVAGE